jgi:hypothetical protein
MLLLLLLLLPDNQSMNRRGQGGGSGGKSRGNGRARGRYEKYGTEGRKAATSHDLVHKFSTTKFDRKDAHSKR